MVVEYLERECGGNHGDGARDVSAWGGSGGDRLLSSTAEGVGNRGWQSWILLYTREGKSRTGYRQRPGAQAPYTQHSDTDRRLCQSLYTEKDFYTVFAILVQEFAPLQCRRHGSEKKHKIFRQSQKRPKQTTSLHSQPNWQTLTLFYLSDWPRHMSKDVLLMTICHCHIYPARNLRKISPCTDCVKYY